MCGIAGFIDTSSDQRGAPSEKIAMKMARVLSHRGPDSHGVWIDNASGIVFSHTRLSILDLSSAGHQPMHSSCGRYVITYNGEIYNFLELKKELEKLSVAPRWKGHSDTEVLLAALSSWGLVGTLERLNGMFAFALWDRKEKVLTLARDRFGEKPLYFGFQKGIFLFGSELKALRAHPAWTAEIDRGALTLYMRYSYIPAPWSIYQGIQKVLPGHYVQIQKERVSDPLPYWTLSNTVENALQQPFEGNETDAVIALDSLLRDAIDIRMRADVPVGVFLSGGIDSSTVTALLQSQSSNKIRTFSIGMKDTGYNEALHAKEVAKHLGTEHTELYVSPNDALEVIPLLPKIYDEPFADSSQIPTYLVSKMTREYVTVALSGDGGDELFGGYTRHFKSEGLWKALHSAPLWGRKIIKQGVEGVPPAWWNHLPSFIKSRIPGELTVGGAGDRLHKLAMVLDVSSREELYNRLLSTWQEPEELVLNGSQPKSILSNLNNCPRTESFIERMMYFDSMSYLPEDILVKVDRASMSVSLESRIPLLDHRVAEFAWRLPLDMKVNNGLGKWILRQVLYRYVPSELIERPKQGFGIPINSWLRGPLRDWAEALLDAKALKEQGFLDGDVVRKCWQEHLAGKRSWQHQLWAVLMFQAWFESNENDGHPLLT